MVRVAAHPVFLQLSPFSQPPHLQPSEVESAQWVPLNLLFTPKPKWGTIHIDFARHAPRSSAMRGMLRFLIGKMSFRCIELPNRPTALAEINENDPSVSVAGLMPKADLPDAKSEDDDGITRQLADSEKDYMEQCTPHLQLWGLTLGMTLDFLAHMSTHNMHLLPRDARSKTIVERVMAYTPSSWLLGAPDGGVPARKAPSVVEVFPRFSYPDVNFWIWVFGWRYRVIQRGWERSIGTEMERRAHWSGLALAAF